MRPDLEQKAPVARQLELLRHAIAELEVASHLLALIEAADRIETAVKKVLAQGLRTPDIHSAGTTKVGTREMGDAVVKALR